MDAEDIKQGAADLLAQPDDGARVGCRNVGTVPPNVDIVGIHRDLSNYYRAYGLFDSSTPSGLFERAVWPNIVAVPNKK